MHSMRIFLFVSFLLTGCRFKKHTTDALIEVPKTVASQTQAIPTLLLKNKITSPDDCLNPEQERPSDKLVGGQKSTIYEYPFLVSFNKLTVPNTFQGHFCSGVFLNNKWILTAAACFFQVDGTSLPLSQIQVLTSSSTLLDPLEAKSFILEKLIIHPKFEFHPKNSLNNLALVSIKGNFTNLVAELQGDHQSSEMIPQAKVFTVGHGFSNPAAQTKCNQLVKANMTISDPSSCDQFIQQQSAKALTSYQICTQGIELFPCHGDIGGPLLYFDPTTHIPFLVGITSYTPECHETYTFNLYTNIHHFRDWIKDQISK